MLPEKKWLRAEESAAYNLQNDRMERCIKKRILRDRMYGESGTEERNKVGRM